MLKDSDFPTATCTICFSTITCTLYSRWLFVLFDYREAVRTSNIPGAHALGPFREPDAGPIAPCSQEITADRLHEHLS